MKKGIYALFSLLLISGPMHCQLTPLSVGPIFTPETEEISYGEIPVCSDQNRYFTFTNTGTEFLVLQVKTSCGCLVPEWPKDPIAPGETSQIRLIYDTCQPGVFKKSLHITTNEISKIDSDGNPVYKQYAFPVTGRVLEN